MLDEVCQNAKPRSAYGIRPGFTPSNRVGEEALGEVARHMATRAPAGMFLAEGILDLTRAGGRAYSSAAKRGSGIASNAAAGGASMRQSAGAKR